MSKYKGLFTFDVENHRYLPVEQADGLIAEMDYHPESEPAEPLIKDELAFIKVIRRFVKQNIWYLTAKDYQRGVVYEVRISERKMKEE